MSDQGHMQEETKMTDQPDDTAPPVPEALASDAREPQGIDTAFRDRLLARMPASVREQALANWAGRPRDERERTYEQATQADWELVLASRAAEREREWRESVPREYADAHPSKLAADQHPGKVREWWASDYCVLYLRSEIPGNGKTYAAYAIANAVCNKIRCVATTLADLVTAQSTREYDGTAWRAAIACDLLILDDLGQEAAIGWEKEKARDLLHRLLTIRTGEGRRTIITTNRTGAWIESKDGYGSAIADRLGHEAVVLEFTGPSRRQGVKWGDLN